MLQIGGRSTDIQSPAVGCSTISKWSNDKCATNCASASSCHKKCAKKCSTACACNQDDDDDSTPAPPEYDFAATWVITGSPDADCPAFPKNTEVPAKCCDGGEGVFEIPLTFVNPSKGNCNYMQGFVPGAIGVVYGSCSADGTATYGEVCRPGNRALPYPVTTANQDFPQYAEAAELLAGFIPINITRTTVPPEGCGCAFTKDGQMDFTKTTCAGDGRVGPRLSGNPIRFPTPINSTDPGEPAWTGGCERVVEFSNTGSTRCFAVTDVQEYGPQFASALPGNIYLRSQGCTLASAR